jgi:hypothetical protein
MPAYTVDITVPKCNTCGRKATKMVYNARNGYVGSFCAEHANAALARLNAT